MGANKITSALESSERDLVANSKRAVAGIRQKLNWVERCLEGDELRAGFPICMEELVLTMNTLYALHAALNAVRNVRLGQPPRWIRTPQKTSETEIRKV